MTLAELFARAGVAPRELRGGDVPIHRATLDSRRVPAGSLFVAMPGGTNDPHRFLGAAFDAGASAALVHDSAAFAGSEQPMALLDASAYEDALWRLMDALYEHPTREMTLVGITGTNGKTTTAWLVRQLFTLLGRKAGYLGTLGFSLDGHEDVELQNTTPFCVEVYDLMGQARDAGVEAMAIEISSHALAQKRVDGLEFDVAVFTNLTQDHLDFHGTMEGYRDAKLRLFTELLKSDGRSVINLDRPEGAAFARAIGNEFTGYGSISGKDYFALTATRFRKRFGAEPAVMIFALSPNVAVDRVSFQIAPQDFVSEVSVTRFTPVESPLGGAFNVENVLAALSALVALGHDDRQVAELTPRLRPVPGRFEPVPNDRGIGILVDYAHTPDALEKVLDTARELTSGRLVAVFGCGGDRDRTKRPKMARAASERADLTVVTSDNPRTEDPRTILDEVRAGIVEGKESIAILDRREAVAYAISRAAPGDTVVIAGKGHENYQILGREKVHMDDRELAREGLEKLGG